MTQDPDLDLYLSALDRQANIAVHVATTTNLCRAGQEAHGMASSSAIALGRTLTASALLCQAAAKPGTLGLQISCSGRLGQVVAEARTDGDLRGYCRRKDLALPQMNEGDIHRRRSIAIAVVDGILAVTREPEGEHFSQSTSELVSGELDEDVEHFLIISDQVPSLLVCDVLFDDKEQILHAAGLLCQVMPDTDPKRWQQLIASDLRSSWATTLLRYGADARALLGAIVPSAQEVGEPLPLRWRCRCSYERVVDALQMLKLEELDEIVANGETTEVRCDFCAEEYQVPPSQVAILRRMLGETPRV